MLYHSIENMHMQRKCMYVCSYAYAKKMYVHMQRKCMYVHMQQKKENVCMFICKENVCMYVPDNFDMRGGGSIDIPPPQ
jgi:hypothetical protein